jgi:RNA polymerase sigma factor (TIGR02999 family)
VDSQRAEVTRLLREWSEGREGSLDALVPHVYGELRRLAARYLRQERAGHTLQATALVHEAFLKLIDQDASWQNRAHFFGVAAQLMRRILVDYARGHGAAKRGGGVAHVELDEAVLPAPALDIDLLALDEALTRLAALDEQQARIVELKFFGGLTLDETAEVMHISPATVSREWTIARAWLFLALKEPAAS